VLKIFPNRLALRSRLILLSIGIATPLFLVNCGLIFDDYRGTLNRGQELARLENTEVMRAIGQWLSAEVDAIKTLAFLCRDKNPASRATTQLLRDSGQTQRNWGEILIVSQRGEVFALATSHRSLRKSVIAWPNKDFSSRIFRDKQTAISGCVSSPLSRKPVVMVGTPIINNNLSTALLVTIDVKAVQELLRGITTPSGTVMAVLDQNAHVIARTIDKGFWRKNDQTNKEGGEAIENLRRGLLQTAGSAPQVNRAYSFETIPNLDWKVLVGTPTKPFFERANVHLKEQLSLLGIALLLTLACALLAASGASRALSKLVRELLALAKGDASKSDLLSARDELSPLAQAFNEMSEKLSLDQQQKFMVERLSGAIRQSLDLEQILNTTVRELGKALEASRCCLALVDENARYESGSIELVFNHVWYDRRNGGVPLSHRSILITPKSIMSDVLEQGSILSLDLLEENRATPLFENQNNSPEDWTSIKSLMACPITGDQGPMGIILIQQCNKPRTWTEAELALVETVSKHVVLAMHNARLYKRTKNMAEQEMLINHIVRSVRSSLDLDTILNTVTQELALALQADRCQIAQPRPEGPLVITHEFHAALLSSCNGISLYSENIDCNPQRGSDGSVPGKNYVLGIDLSRIADQNISFDPRQTRSDTAPSATLKEAPIAVIHDTRTDSRTVPFQEFVSKSNARSLIAAPLISENKLIGLLIVQQCREYRLWQPREVQLVAAIADQLAIAVTHAHLFAQVRYQAITDGLTRLYNHIYFKNRLNEELRLAQRKGTPCSLLMIDLDHLKQINDSFGHPVGDAAIRQVAAVLRTMLRSGDTAARYGGEEFAVILPETALLEAALIGDRLCSRIANTNIPGLGKITVSVGVASYPRQAKDASELIDKADRALYAAKIGGRNQIRICDEAKLILNRNSKTEERLKMIDKNYARERVRIDSR
jgi:diguanylate cyclase (GGDEF)-like protein